MHNSDVIIIGAGLSGMYQLYRLRELGIETHVYEAGTDVGGTWYWNRYPGARFDSESWTYGLSFSNELLQEWEWSEHFAAQPETLRYCNHFADKFDLRRNITFNARVTAIHFDEKTEYWGIVFEDGSSARCRLLITAIGPLSAPTMPTIEGVSEFKGEAYHTGLWPHHPVVFEGKRVAVIGTGATGVQTITQVAKTVNHLTVFQRTPNWCAPLHNSPITPEEQARIKSSYDEIFERCRNSYACFIHDADPRNTFDVTAEEREAFYEELYNSPGFGIWMGNFRDVLTDAEANATLSKFVARKIRQRVLDPDVADKLIPKNHGCGTRRMPLESGYYEVYNQANVDLVDVNETPIERITETGLQTSKKDYNFDMIIYATGFDAIRGAFDRIDIRGRGGLPLKERWRDGPRTYLGLQVAGFPNLLTLVGPHNAASFCNIPRCIEQNVDWVTDLIVNMQENGFSRVEADLSAENEWTAHVHERGERLLASHIDSWVTGINSNVKGRSKRQLQIYAGGAPKYREICDEVAADGYRGFHLS